MARYDLPTYVIYVSGHFWMFAVKITEWVFSLKSLGLLTPTRQGPRLTSKSQTGERTPKKQGFQLWRSFSQPKQSPGSQNGVYLESSMRGQPV